MRYVAIFEDDVDPARLDPELNRKHFEYLAARSDAILLAGGLRDDAGQPFSGTLWILEAVDKATALALVRDDPYVIANLRPSYRVFAWGKAPHLGAVNL